MNFSEVQSEIIWPKLDEYKKAWMENENIVAVQTLKTSLIEKIRHEAGDFSDKAVDDFESQCEQIEGRWNRPKSEKIH